MSQKSQIRAALENGEILTRRDCYLRFGCFEAGARVTEMREEEGMLIDPVRVIRDGKEYPAWKLRTSDRLPGM